MIIALSKNPIVRLHIDLLNKYESWTQKYWQSNPRHKVTCRICNKSITPLTEEYSPEQCGWRHLKTIGVGEGYKRWICHSCDGHFNEHFINIDDLSNEEIERLYQAGKLNKFIRDFKIYNDPFYKE